MGAPTDRIVFDKPGEIAPLIAAQDACNAEVLHEIVTRPARERSDQLAKQRDAYCRTLLEQRIPHRLHWVIDKPRALRLLLRFVPRWQPTLTIVNLSRPPMATGGKVAGRTAAMASTEGSAKAMADVWLREQALRGREIKGVVFTYTDPSGLPAEIYA